MCEGARFSSTACLLRHEREAHGLHGHGDKPFLCHYEGCERGVPGSGFPRQWNLKDHMKRVHNDLGNTGTSAGNTMPQPPAKGRKRKTSDGPEARPGASRKSTQKNVPAKEARQPPAKPLLEQWMDSRRAIEEMLRSVKKPDDVRTVPQIVEIQERLSSLMQMTTELNPQAQQDGFSIGDAMNIAPTG